MKHRNPRCVRLSASRLNSARNFAGLSAANCKQMCGHFPFFINPFGGNRYLWQSGGHAPAKKNLVDRFLASSSPRQHKSVRLTVKKVRANLRYVEQLWLGTFYDFVVETLSSIAKVTVFGAPGKGTNGRIASPTKFVFPSTQESATWTHFVSLSDVNDIQNDITKWRLRHLAFCCGCQFLVTAIRAGVWLRSDSGNAKRCVDMRYSFEVRNAKLIAQISMSTASAPIWWWFGLKFWN